MWFPATFYTQVFNTRLLPSALRPSLVQSVMKEAAEGRREAGRNCDNWIFRTKRASTRATWDQSPLANPL
ncbi:hypothetical protein MPTK1_4g21290 [Marchantia polymorpha subsp. ruderalis]|uniref:Uncharacterized protein n=2 Tax=Marchantia polymorpha TaxID=3197 RepID=A0AAF6BC93_MARPO|nr:hypothetical protein MARPO_0090s0092 [Marchantia polymorpha]BBN09627.1 hypothetical protein Mp_4g21290 [Marchantia polymorpha subsp. ruderalis]|eukprot:PTQ33359.1 hypothetical protein MARPO_0090s0092 [Marchantia polymorpha]